MAKVKNRNNRTRGVTVPVGYTTYERVQAADEDSQDKSQEMDYSHKTKQSKQSYGNEKTVRSQTSIAAWMNTNMNMKMNDIIYKTNTNTRTRTRWSHQCQCQCQFHCKMIFITSCFILFAIMMKTYGNRNWYFEQYYGHDNGQSSSSRIYNFNVRYSGMTNGNDNGISFSRPHRNNNGDDGDDDNHNGNGDGNDGDDGDTNLFADALERAIMDSFANTSVSSISKLYDHYHDRDIAAMESSSDEEGDTSSGTGSGSGSDGENNKSSSDTSRSQMISSVPVPVPISKSILHDLDTPQGKAFHWIVHQDTYTHNLQRKFKFRSKSKSEMEMKNTMDMDMDMGTTDTGTGTDIDMEQHSHPHPHSYSYHLYDEIKIVQRYILLVFFFQTGGEYNVNIAKRFTPQSNVLVNWAVFPYGDVGFFSGSGKGSGRRGLGNKRKRNSTRGRGHGDECNWNINIYGSRGSAKGHRYRYLKQARARTKYGVTCDANDRVVEMNFNGMGLGRGGPRSSSSSLSSSSGSGSNITTTTTTHNYSYSSVPAELGLLSHLKRLDLRDNHLTGTIPDSIGGFVVAKMKVGGDVDGHRNGHEDVVQGDVVDGNGDGNVWNGALEYLDVSGNKLVGPVPESLGSLVHLNLQSIFLHSNRIHGGSIPPSLCEVPGVVFGKNISNEHDHDDLSTKTLNRGHDDDDDDDDDDNMANFQVKASSSSSRIELWADCAQEFDPIQCKCCTYCCDIMSLEEEEEGCVFNTIIS